MNSPKVGQVVIDIKATAEKQPSTSKFILPLRALIGSNTVAAPNGIGKRTGIKDTKDYQSFIGDTTAELDKVCISATVFLCANYGKNTMKLVKV